MIQHNDVLCTTTSTGIEQGQRGRGRGQGGSQEERISEKREEIKVSMRE